MGALDGIRVVEWCDESGAYGGKLLADMGADVVKIEPPGSDPTRVFGPFVNGPDDPGGGLFFRYYNTNKRSLILDPEAEPERLRRLLRAADVLLVTGKPARLAGLGLDMKSLAEACPRLIVAAISGFGLSGPRAYWLSCDTVAQALGGMLFVNGHAGEAPLRSLGLQAYHSAGTYAAIGILLALLERRRSGSGQRVEVSLQECVAATVEHVSGFFDQNGQIQVRRGTLHWSRYFRAAKCRDGYALHCSLGDWTSLIEWVKADGKAQDLAGPEWEDFHHRRRNCVHLFDVLDGWAKGYSAAELVEGAQLRRIPYALVLPLADLPENPQLRERGFFVPVRHDELDRTLTYPGAPYVFSVTPWRLQRRPPLAGEHGAEVEREWSTPSPEDSVADSAAIGSRKRVLEGLRVLDFTWVVAGPVATRILADHGAEVIKIERRDSLDFGNRRGGLTGNLNRGKRSVVVNMADPRGVDVVRDLVRHCDVVIDNFSARVMRNWGLDYEGLRAIKPDVIAISMSGFGHTGPQRDYVSYGPTLQALSGYTMEMRHPGGEPAGWGFSYADMAGGYSAALAVLLALWHRERSGQGQFIDLSQFEAVSAVVGPALLGVLAGGETPGPFGNRSQERPAAPHGVYRCRDLPGDEPAVDRWCAICVFTEEQWQRFSGVLGRPEWTRDARFYRLEDRLAHQDELDVLVGEWTRERDAESVMEELQKAGVPAGLVANARDLCRRDPHLRECSYWAEVATPEGGSVTVDGVPARLSRSPGYVAGPGPLLGEDTDGVLREVLGLTPTEIEELRATGVVH